MPARLATDRHDPSLARREPSVEQRFEDRG
jgi:hypothetical protein